MADAVPQQLNGATERFLNDMAPRLCRFTGTQVARREFGRRVREARL